MRHDLYDCGHGQLRRASWTRLSDENWSSCGCGMRSATSEMTRSQVTG